MFQLNDSIVFIYEFSGVVYYLTSSNIVFYLIKIDDFTYKCSIVSDKLKDNIVKLYTLEKQIEKLKGN